MLVLGVGDVVISMDVGGIEWWVVMLCKGTYNRSTDEWENFISNRSYTTSTVQ